MSEQPSKMSCIEEAIEQVKMISSISLVSQNNLKYVPLPHVLFQLEIAAERDQVSRQLQISQVLNELLISIQRELNSRDPDQRRNLTMEDVTLAFLNKIQQVQSGQTK